jgi:hypothetical protein
MVLWSTRGARRLALMGILLVPAACESVPAPVQDMAAAERAVQAAADAGADSLAPAELEQARRKLDAARSAMQAQQHDKARQLAEQTVVDAELAQVTAGAEEAARAVAAMRAQIGDPARAALRPAAEL